MSNNFIQNIFSVKNIEKHKVITILWLKFKIKRKEPDDFTFVLIKENGKKVYNPKIPGLTLSLSGGGHAMARRTSWAVTEVWKLFGTAIYMGRMQKWLLKNLNIKIKNLTVWRMA